MSSGEILRLLGTYMTLNLNCRPSSMMDIDDAYTAFCFDEACAFIIRQLKDGKEPIIKVDKNEDNKKEKPQKYSRPSELFGKFKNVKIEV